MAKVALLIGVGNYKHPDALKPLISASKDVAAMQRILLNAQMGEFSEVTPLIDPDPMQMQEAIETLYRDRARDDLVLLFFSGHGIKDDSGKLYFSTRVTRKTPKGELVKSTAVPARFVQEIMGNSRSRRQVMILDCCFSGAFDPTLNAKDDGSLDVQGQLGAEGRVVLTSSSSTQYSFEQQGSELSIYTRFLVEGIETGAADQDNDGRVSVRELHEYATKKVQETAPTMNPKIIVLKDEGFDVVFAKAQIADPKLKYRKDAERYSMRGEISPVGRTVLNTQRMRLGLTLEEAEEIENQVLQPFRERLKHLEDYRSAFVAEVARQYPLAPETLSELNDLQEIFGLRQEDVAQIEQEVIAQVTNQSEATQVTSQSETYQQLEQNRQQNAENLQQQQEAERPQTKRQQYEQEVLKKISLGIPLNDGYIRNQLKQLQRKLELTDADVNQIEQQVLSQRRSEPSQALTASPPPVQPQYRQDSVASKIPQANPVKTLDTSQPNTNDPPQQLLESGHSSSKVGATTQQRFWLMWTLAYTCGSGFGWFIVNQLFSNLDFGNAAFNLMKGAIVGFVLGGAQWLLLRQVNHRMKLWIVLTTVSYSASYAIASTLFGKLYEGSVPLILIEALYGLVIGSLIGLAQWFVLKPLVQQSKTWLVSVSIAETVGVAIGWGVFAAMYRNSAPDPDNINYALHGLIGGGWNGAICGLITGRVMLRLLRLNRVQ